MLGAGEHPQVAADTLRSSLSRHSVPGGKVAPLSLAATQRLETLQRKSFKNKTEESLRISRYSVRALSQLNTTIIRWSGWTPWVVVGDVVLTVHLTPAYQSGLTHSTTESGFGPFPMIFAYDFSVITDSSSNRPPLESLVISLIAESRAMPESPQVGAQGKRILISSTA